jgi:hypothetical protein
MFKRMVALFTFTRRDADPIGAALERLPSAPPVMREARPLADAGYPPELDHLVGALAAPTWRESPAPPAPTPADVTETVRPPRPRS